jgi:hypothetical protein
MSERYTCIRFYKAKSKVSKGFFILSLNLLIYFYFDHFTLHQLTLSLTPGRLSQCRVRLHVEGVNLSKTPCQLM